MSTRFNMPNFEPEFAAVVDSIRAIGVITGLSNDGKNTTVTTENSLKAGEVITINSGDYGVKSTTDSDIIIKGVVTTGVAWKAKAPYFMHGHILEVADRLLKIGSTPGIYKWQKYPIVILEQDISYPVNDIGYKKPSINVYIANKTEPNYIAEERRVNNFVPNLNPIYKDLMEAIDASTSMMLINDGTVTPRYYWGSSLNNKQPVNDPLDAIEISDIELELITKC